jgi:uncharacterized membrane protein YhiD involved in acid resistance
VVGLTTAATIFMSAAIGIAVGGGFYLLAGTATLITIAANFGLRLVEQVMEGRRPPVPTDEEPRRPKVGRPTSPRA